MRTRQYGGAPTNSADLTLRQCDGGSTTATLERVGAGQQLYRTTAATTAALKRPRIGGWAEADRRESFWRCWCSSEFRHDVADGARCLAHLVLLATLGSLAACGGGGSSGGGGGGRKSWNDGGKLCLFTVTGTGSDPAKTKETTTFTVTVN